MRKYEVIEMTKSGIEIERKYIIKIPEPCLMKACDGYSESSIIQIYLNSSPSVTHRIRSRSFSLKTEYTETKKVRIDKLSAVEDEREISEKEFSELSKNIKAGTSPVRKTRYTFNYMGKIFEVDIYPEWKYTCILETELLNRDEKVDFPDFIETVAEVTGDKRYSNAAMSVRFPEEVKYE
jgi:CYTH domain-containing protein